MQHNDAHFNILSLSGGGFRGLFTARVLAELEQEAGKPIGKCFDLICGTSVGGILALAIGLEKPMGEIAAVVEKRGPEVFSRRFWGRLFVGAKYGNGALKSMADEIFGNHRIADSKHRLMIPAVNYSAGEPRFFKTAHHPDFKRDFRLSMVDVAMATGAAPGFFPMHTMSGTMSRYVDGGLVGNNPAAFGFHEAVVFLGERSRNVHLLSIGTMGGRARVSPSESANRGFWIWRKKLPLLIISMQERVANNIVRHQLGGRYHHIDEHGFGLDLDAVNEAAIADLKNGAENAARKFVGLKACRDFLGHSAIKFKPCHKIKGDNRDAKDA